MPVPPAPWDCRHGVWFLLANPDMAEIPAADVVDRQLRSMTPEEKTAATIIALAGPLSLAQILRISGPKAVDALDTAGIIAVSAGHDRLVRPASPIVGEIIRHRVPAGRSSALRSSVLSFPSEQAAVPGRGLEPAALVPGLRRGDPSRPAAPRRCRREHGPGSCNSGPGRKRHPGRPVPLRGPDPARLFPLHCRAPAGRSGVPGVRPAGAARTAVLSGRPARRPARVRDGGPGFSDFNALCGTCPGRTVVGRDRRCGTGRRAPEPHLGRQVHGRGNRAARTGRYRRNPSRNPRPGSFPPRRTTDRAGPAADGPAPGRGGLERRPQREPGASPGVRGPCGTPLPEPDPGR